MNYDALIKVCLAAKSWVIEHQKEERAKDVNEALRLLERHSGVSPAKT